MILPVAEFATKSHVPKSFRRRPIAHIHHNSLRFVGRPKCVQERLVSNQFGLDFEKPQILPALLNAPRTSPPHRRDRSGLGGFFRRFPNPPPNRPGSAAELE